MRVVRCRKCAPTVAEAERTSAERIRIAQVEADAIAKLNRGALGRLSDRVSTAAAPHIPRQPVTYMYAEGGPVQETGLALVHKGEYVVPSDGTRVSAGSMGNSITVNINTVQGLDSTSIAEALQERLQMLITTS